MIIQMHFFQAFALIMFVSKDVLLNIRVLTQLSFTCSKLTIETVEQGVKYVQS